ncbi:hypothetical protein M758_12G165300 [Ceratodon purpureus]|nr:hypothetical protein M758_12G165300 [Ceratodon purpureus]
MTQVMGWNDSSTSLPERRHKSSAPQQRVLRYALPWCLAMPESSWRAKGVTHSSPTTGVTVFPGPSQSSPPHSSKFPSLLPSLHYSVGAATVASFTTSCFQVPDHLLQLFRLIDTYLSNARSDKSGLLLSHWWSL